MAPTRTKNLKIASPPGSKSTAQTSTRSPIKKKHMMITQSQKQSLIDNLQLEITERARKLRAQYALQAQNLRTRVELRVNRIPKSLRKAKMGELLVKHLEAAQRKEVKEGVEPKTIEVVANQANQANPKGQAPKTAIAKASKQTNPARTRGTKRNSDALSPSQSHTDKENAPDPSHTDPLSNPKKRTKTAATTRQPTNPSTILSPKSSNSRTFPHSPIRSPQRPHISRPASPLKPNSVLTTISPSKSAALAATVGLASLVRDKMKGATTRPTPAPPARKATNPKSDAKSRGVGAATTATATRSKRGAATASAAAAATHGQEQDKKEPPRSVSGSSNTSGASAGTTVVSRKGAGGKTAAAAAAAGGKKGAAAGKKEAASASASKTVEGPAPGRRVLRKRP
ncbi:hypothetical protein MMC20_001498 [Loxospora ochrophaea]|nr:hypothetical protein [Loxospora ochrophaea]